MPTRHKTARPAADHLTPKQRTALSAQKFGVPFWILWGVAGAESTWGQGGSNLFGLLDAAEGANVSNWKSASEQAARTLAGLHKQYGDWSQAIEHYSGGSYGISHPAQLASEQGVTPANSGITVRRILGGTTKDVVGIPVPGLPFEIGPEGIEPKQNIPGTEVPNPLEKIEPNAPLGTPEGPLGLSIIPEPIVNSFKDFDAIAKLIVQPAFWLRVGEGIGGIILLYLALKALTGASVPGESAAKSYAKAAAFKRLPPKQRVKG